jgi:hypothetical protein
MMLYQYGLWRYDPTKNINEQIQEIVFDDQNLLEQITIGQERTQAQKDARQRRADFLWASLKYFLQDYPNNYQPELCLKYAFELFVMREYQFIPTDSYLVIKKELHGEEWAKIQY